jgi:hypothetical protein
VVERPAAAAGPWSWAEVCARRLARHSLDAPSTVGPAAVAAAVAGVHAQVGSAAELSVGTRLADATRADVRAALWDDRSLVKTLGPRGTVHLLATADLPLWTGALAAVPAAGPAFPADVAMTAEQIDAVVAAIADALADAALTVDGAHRRGGRAGRPVGRRSRHARLPGAGSPLPGAGPSSASRPSPASSSRSRSKAPGRGCRRPTPSRPPPPRRAYD